MLSELYWIDAIGAPKLAIMARPRAGEWLEDKIENWRRLGVELVVSLLESDEVDDLGLGLEEPLCKSSGIEFVSFPIPDRGLPDSVGTTMRFAAAIGRKGKVIAIHCRAGIGRSSIMAAAVLVARGTAPGAALAAIAKARGVSVPDTDAQRDWVLKLDTAL